MKLSKTVYSIFVLIVLLVFTVSCSMDSQEVQSSLVNVFLNIPSEKVLNVSDMQSQGHLRYFYTAAALFTGHAEGATHTPVEITVSTGTAGIGSFSKGNWRFTVFAVDDNNNTVLSGSTDAVLKPGFDNVVSISLLANNGSGDGTLSLSFTGPYLGEGDYALAVLYRKIGEETFSKEQEAWSINTEDKCVVYNGTLTLPAGIYEVRFIYIKDGIQTGGETSVLNISGGFTTGIEGSVDNGLVVSNFVFVNENMVENGRYQLELDLKAGAEIVLAWNCGESVPISLTWELDGVQSCGSTFPITPQEGVTYSITCTAITENGEETSVISIEVSVSEPQFIDLLFLRCPGLTEGTACVGYTDLQGNDVEFPYSFDGEVSVDKTPSDYGLVPVIVDATDKNNVKECVFVQVDKEWKDRASKWGNQFSYVASRSAVPNTSLKSAVVKCDLLSNAFFYCTELETIVFAEGCHEVTTRFCQGDKKLKTIYVGKDVEKIHLTAFQNCPSITTVYIEEGSKLKVSDFAFDDGVTPGFVFNYQSDLFR